MRRKLEINGKHITGWVQHQYTVVHSAPSVHQFLAKSRSCDPRSGAPLDSIRHLDHLPYIYLLNLLLRTLNICILGWYVPDIAGGD